MRYAASSILFWIGHFVSITAMRIGIGYPVYNWLMAKSAAIQGEEEGPWKKL